MKGRINKYGHLNLTKNGISKIQWCKHHVDNTPCNDRCPLFGEVVQVVTELGYQLRICEKTDLFFDKDKWQDDRKG